VGGRKRVGVRGRNCAFTQKGTKPQGGRRKKGKTQTKGV